MHLAEPYEPRRIHPLPLLHAQGWRLKVGGIAYRRAAPRADLVAHAHAVALEELPRPSVSATRYGVGFLGVHEGRGADFVFVGWWEEENELHLRVHHSRAGDPARALARAGPASPVACAWDLRLIAHERDAWVRHVLANPSGPDVEAYLADALDATV